MNHAAGYGQIALFLWVDNAADTWKAVVDGEEIPPASGMLAIGGLEPGKTYAVQWWDPHATDSAQSGFSRMSLGPVRVDGSALLEIEDLSRDLALKLFKAASCYLPLAVRSR